MRLSLQQADRPIIGVINENENVLFLPPDRDGAQHCYMIRDGGVQRVEMTLEQVLSQSRNLSERRALRAGDNVNIIL